MADLYNNVLGVGTNHIANDLASYEAARSGFFTFTLIYNTNGDNTVLDNIARKMGEYDGKFAGITAEKVSEILKLNTTSAKVPHFTVETLSFKRGNEVVKFAGVPTFDGGDLTIDDIVDQGTKLAIQCWLELTYDPHTRLGGRMVNYKTDCLLTEYTQDYVQVRSWKLYKAFVPSYSEDNFNKESDDRRKLTVNIEYDRAELLTQTTNN